MSFFVGVDVSKEKFDACGIGESGENIFSVSLHMNKKGFEELLCQLPHKSTTTLLFGMESTASYHITLVSYLTAKGYRVAIRTVLPLLLPERAEKPLPA